MAKAENYKPMMCPVCGKYHFRAEGPEYLESHTIECIYCGWVNDIYQTEHPDFPNGENELSLN